ncbi:MAG: hypothetical protein U0X86_000319 [Wolbachia endosymbiont of Xenopsylla cheopis]
MVKTYCNCHEKNLKFIEAKGQDINKNAISLNMTCSHAETKFRKISDENINEGDEIYKMTLRCIACSLFLIAIAGSMSFITLYFRVYNDTSYYYRNTTSVSRDFSMFTGFLAILMLLIIFYFHRALSVLKKDEELSKSNKSYVRSSSVNIYPSPLTDDTTLKLLSTPRSSLSSCDTPQLISLLPSPTPSSGVFSFPSISPSPTLKVEVHSVSFLVEDIMPKLLDAPKPSSSGIGTSIKSSQISKSKVSLSSENLSIISESSLLFFLRKAESWPSLYNKEEPLELKPIFPASVDDIMQQTPSTPREWTPPSSPSTFSSSSIFTPYLTSSSNSNDLRFLGLSPSLSPGSCMYSSTKF